MLRDPLVGLEPVTAADTAGLKFEGSIDCCHPREPSFWGNVRANAAQIEQLVTQNRELYQRYLALFDLPGYYETARPSYMAPLYRVPTAVQSLFLASTSLQMQSGDDARTQAALKSLHQDITLWHRILTGEGTLISKMLAVAFLQTDFLILADMITDPRTAIPQNMDEFLPQFELSDWNIRHTFAAEFRVITSFYRQAQALADIHWQPPDTSSAQRVWNRLSSQFFKLNATENLEAKLMSDLAGLATLDPANFSTEQARYRKWQQVNSNFVSVRTLYNPVGKMLVALAVPAYKNYPLRPYDAAALQRLVRLSFEIRRQRIAPTAVAEFMKLHPEWSTHPADGRSFVWNASTGEIAIQPVAEQTAYRVFSVQIWKAATPMAPAD
jgi:hypothetical protein